MTDKLGALAQIVDKNLMRQKVLIGLALPRDMCKEIDENLIVTRLVLDSNPWPDEKELEKRNLWPWQEQQTFSVEESDSEVPPPSPTDDPVDVEGYSREVVSEMLELKGEGQARHWIKETTENCCAEDEEFCRVPKRCLRCSVMRHGAKMHGYGQNALHPSLIHI